MPNLIVIPTWLESEYLKPKLDQWTDWRIANIGFGPIAAASQTAALIAQHQPQRMCLIGIAGVFQNDSRVGQAERFGRVRCHGIGAQGGNHYLSATELKWPMVESVPIGEVIDLENDKTATLLTSCTASGDNQEAAWRMTQYPDVVAEDMEGFGAALSCCLANVPLEIVRGYSNVVGNREHSTWRIEDALNAAASLAIEEVLR